MGINLSDALVRRLQPYAGETGKNEGATDVLDRLLTELELYRLKQAEEDASE